MLTLEQFSNTRIKTDIVSGARDLRIPKEMFEGAVAMHIFEGDCFITEMADGKFHLLIDCDEWVSDDINELIATLYFEHYAWEAHNRTLGDLTAFYGEYLAHNKLEEGCAHEHLMGSDLTREQRRWMTYFVDLWDIVETGV